MVTRNVNKSMRGVSLIEFMLASLMGSFALIIVGSIFIQNHSITAQRSQEILLLQNLSSIAQTMKEDVLLAGYDGINRMASRLSGSANILHVQNTPTLIGYVYRAQSGGSSAYRNVVYRREDESIKLCEKAQPNPLSVVSAADSGFGGYCYSLFDPAQISVRDFSVKREELTGASGVSSALTTITLGAALTNNPQVNYSLTFRIQQRNWQ